ncbi:MAG: hypothetical protein KDD11_05500 [Acidobacteria bacterium]|nr:hypothetical protein [Acidobacteriota bacterium]
MDMKLISDVLVFPTNPTQVAFVVESSDTSKLDSLNGFWVGTEGKAKIELNLSDGYTYQSQPVLWRQPGGDFGPTPPPGFSVDRASDTQVIVTDDFQKGVNEGYFGFRLQFYDSFGTPLNADPTIVNRPIENG